MKTGDKVRLIDESVLIQNGVHKGVEGVVLYPDYVDVMQEADEDPDGYYVEFTVNGSLERWLVLESEVELIASAA